MEPLISLPPDNMSLVDSLLYCLDDVNLLYVTKLLTVEQGQNWNSCLSPKKTVSHSSSRMLQVESWLGIKKTGPHYSSAQMSLLDSCEVPNWFQHFPPGLSKVSVALHHSMSQICLAVMSLADLSGHLVPAFFVFLELTPKSGEMAFRAHAP